MDFDHNCLECGAAFRIGDWEQRFLRKMELLLPRLCPECRQQRRAAQLNQINLFRRRCDGTGDTIVSNYPPESPYRVFRQEYWYSDAHDGCDFGRPFDFNRPFFAQYADLCRVVPRPALFTDFLHDENSAYTNSAGKNKNCYMIFDSDENWDCYYSYGMNSSRSSMDCTRVQKVELCYEAVDCTNCYGCAYAFNCENCSDSAFIRNCTGCRNCILCSNLRRKEYYVRNKRVSKEEFLNLRATLSTASVWEQVQREFEGFILRFPQKYLRGYQNGNVSGNYLVHCRNAEECFDSMNIWDGKFCTQIFIGIRDALDIHECGDAQLLYDCVNCGYNGYNLCFCSQCLNQVTNLTYCQLCFNGCTDLFGCCGLKRSQYCILNRKYSKDDYSALRQRIVEHMKASGEWGQFFPLQLSSFPYNLSVAQEYFPLSRESAAQKGLEWHEPPAAESRKQTCVLPDSITDADDAIVRETLLCGGCGRNYKFIQQELAFYRQHGLPLARRCFFCRHQERMRLRNPRRLWSRPCDSCGATLSTSYSPNRPESVFCDACYLNALD